MSKNSKTLIFSILILLLGVISPINSLAAIEDCPDKWTIDTSKYPNEELLQAKQKLGFDMATSEQRKLVYFNGPLGDMPKVTGFRTNNLFDPLAYLYINSKVQIDVKVEIKGCSNLGNFRFLSNWFQGFAANEVPFEEISTEDFANKFPQIMGDFQKQKEFSPYVQKIQSEIKKKGKVWSEEKIPSNWAYELIQANNISRILNIRNQWTDKLVTYVRTPNCFVVESISTNLYSYRVSRDIKKCNFSIGYNEWNGRSQKVFLFEPFELDLVNKNSSLTCIKGKIIKKIVGVNPKCPAGFKEKY